MEQDLKRRPDESQDQYFYRLCKMKDMLGFTWPQMTELFNDEFGNSCGESKYRKDWAAFDRIFTANEDKFVGDGKYLEEIRKERHDLEKERKKLQTEKLEYNKWIREEARDELIIEKIYEAICELEPLPHHTFANSSNFMVKDKEKSWILAFGDAHFGAKLVIKGLYNEIINEYNPEIFYKRMNDLFEQVMNIIQRENIDKLYVFDLGDQIDGLLRVGQLMKLRYGVVQSTIMYADWLSRWLNDLSMCCQVVFRQTNGNHSELRMLGQKKGSFEEDNMGKVIYEFIKIRLADNPNIDINKNETGFIFENIQGYNVFGYHGESKKLDDTMKDFEKIYKTNIDVLVAGHLHHAYSETVGVCSDVIRTPSIIGVDDYSMKLHKTSNPGATLFGIEKGKGKTIEYNIKL